MGHEAFVPTERWGADLYGDPCAGCGYAWSVTATEAVRIVDGLPARFRALLDQCTGGERHPDLAWGPVGYVCHVADNLRAWAEGLGAGLQLSARVPVPGYEPDLLAKARRYDRITPEAALWSLAGAAAAWCDVVPRAVADNVVLWHAARGEQRAEDVARNNAHDASHHLWDIRRIMRAAG
ncbi:hypothetical protein ACIRG5_06225 [Lentzea sp. NPDC102401]|uniref:hypothetical protein n=1 Tax=Lentzea sp. NPDC102401 TaxID=3364128 RepID=UPI00381730F8